MNEDLVTRLFLAYFARLAKQEKVDLVLECLKLTYPLSLNATVAVTHAITAPKGA